MRTERLDAAGQRNFGKALLDALREIWHVALRDRMNPAVLLESYAEARLLALVAKKDEEAFAEFYDRTAPALFTVAKAILLDAGLAEDVLQEVYLQIWDKAGLFNPALGKPISWAMALTRNKALDRLRSTKRRSAVLLEVAKTFEKEASGTPTTNVELKESAEIVKESMRGLPANQRRAIELALLGGLAHGEVAEAMQQPLGTVKAWIRRGIIEIRNQLKNRG